MYGWYHEHSRKWYIISDNLHKGSSPWIGNRWWQYQANSDSSHDMWTLFTRSLTRVYTHGFVTNVIQNGGAGIVIYFPNGSTDTAIEATRRLQQLHRRVRCIDESHISCCGLKTRRTSWLYFSQLRSQFYKPWPTTIFHI